MIRMEAKQYPKGTLIEVIPGCEPEKSFPQDKRWVVIGPLMVTSHYMTPLAIYDKDKDYDAMNYQDMQWTERNDAGIFLFFGDRFHVIGSVKNNAGNKMNLSKIEED